MTNVQPLIQIRFIGEGQMVLRSNNSPDRETVLTSGESEGFSVDLPINAQTCNGLILGLEVMCAFLTGSLFGSVLKKNN